MHLGYTMGGLWEQDERADHHQKNHVESIDECWLFPLSRRPVHECPYFWVPRVPFGTTVARYEEKIFPALATAWIN